MGNQIFLEWATYNKDVLPDDAGEVQRQETKQAFYAGAIAVLNVVGKISEDTVSEDEAQKVLEDLFDECEEFVDSVQDEDEEDVDEEEPKV